MYFVVFSFEIFGQWRRTIFWWKSICIFFIFIIFRSGNVRKDSRHRRKRFNLRRKSEKLLNAGGKGLEMWIVVSHVWSSKHCDLPWYSRRTSRNPARLLSARHVFPVARYPQYRRFVFSPFLERLHSFLQKNNINFQVTLKKFRSLIQGEARTLTGGKTEKRAVNTCRACALTLPSAFFGRPDWKKFLVSLQLRTEVLGECQQIPVNKFVFISSPSSLFNNLLLPTMANPNLADMTEEDAADLQFPKGKPKRWNIIKKNNPNLPNSMLTLNQHNVFF